jgi:Zn-dependent protease
MQSSFTLGRIGGIRVGIHYTWLFAFILIAWSLAAGYFPAQAPRLGAGAYWLLGIVAALLLFASVLLHELSHSFVAIARGLQVDSITLFIFGGVSNLKGDSQNPKDEFLISVVGPLTSLVLGGVFWVISRAISPVSAAGLIVGYLAYINLALGVFNLVPGFPLDGGRVFRSIVWAVTDSNRKATQIASYVGQAVGFGLILWGVFQLLSGDFLGGLWIAFIGWFLNSAAESTRHQQAFDESLRGVPVSQLMTTELAIIPPTATVRDFVWDQAIHRGRRAMLVADNGRLAGLVSVSDAKKVPQEEWDRTPVTQVMTPAPLKTVGPDEDLSAAMQLMVAGEFHQVPVMRDGKVVGLVTRSDVLRFLQLRDELRLPPPPPADGAQPPQARLPDRVA